MDGSERFVAKGSDLPYSVLDFWRWAYSDLRINTQRGALAEYIVSTSLGESGQTERSVWDAYDLKSPSGVKIEVKASSYVQAWEQTKPSQIRFDIAPHRSWTPQNGYEPVAKRHADVYVFCLFTGTRAEDSLLQLDLWKFYVLPTSTLNERLPQQKVILLSALKRLMPVETDYHGLRDAIDAAAGVASTEV